MVEDFETAVYRDSILVYGSDFEYFIFIGISQSDLQIFERFKE